MRLIKLGIYSLLLLMIIHCSKKSEDIDSEYVSLTNYIQQLKNVKNSDHELEIFTGIWSVWDKNHAKNISFIIGATDSQGKQVITRLNKAVEPVEVSLYLEKRSLDTDQSLWIIQETFVPLDIYNCYVLLRE